MILPIKAGVDCIRRCAFPLDRPQQPASTFFYSHGFVENERAHVRCISIQACVGNPMKTSRCSTKTRLSKQCTKVEEPMA
jgi:hypothetical protein